MADLNTKGINTSYVLDELNKFKRAYQFKGAILQATEVLARPDGTENLDLVEQLLMSKLGQHGATADPGGVLLSDVDSFLDYLDRTEENEFITGIPELDRKHVVPVRGKLLMLQGATSAGKTWFLVELGKWALMRHHKVLHVTLEIAEDDVRQRYFQNLIAAAGWEDSARPR
jgi:hypothetical protein